MGFYSFKMDSLQEEKFLQTKICNLPINLENSPLMPYIQQLYKELKLKNIHFKPTVWVSDDWYSPDGYAGFALPFYLLHPKLIKLEHKYTQLVEGSSPNELMKLLRHETAHALDNAYGLRLVKRRQKLFGLSKTPYPKSYIPKDHQNEFVSNLGDHYGQSHPEEDFAETFAFWLDPYSNWKKSYPQSSLAHQKLLLVDDLMRELASKKSKGITNRTFDEVSTLKITLEKYYLDKRKRLGKVGLIDIKKDLHKFFPYRVQSNKVIGVGKVIERHKSNITNEMLKTTDNKLRPRMKRELNIFLTEIQEYCDTNNLTAPQSHRSVKYLSSLIKRYSNNINLDSNRIIM